MSSYRRKVTCRHCWKTGHNKRGCPQYKQELAEGAISDWNTLKPRKCSYCGKPAHDRRTCDDLHKDKVNTILCNRKWVELVLKDLEASGIGVGSMLRIKQDDSPCPGFFLAMVTGFKWENLFYKHPTKAWVKIKTFYGRFKKSYYYDEGNISFGDEHCPIFSEEAHDPRSSNHWNQLTLRGSVSKSPKVEVVSAHGSSRELSKYAPAEVLSGGTGAADWFHGRQSADYYENGGN